MKFYKENNVNPLGSCLPLAAQLPVFISLFYMLREDLRINICPQTQLAYQASHHVSAAHTIPCGPNNGANFLFISDITNKATGITLLVLIVLYVGTQLASSLMMASPTMDKTQRQIMTFMPLVFVFVIINFPAGLLVYWITTNLWTVGQQSVIRRKLGHQPATGGDSAGGDSSGGGDDNGAGVPAPTSKKKQSGAPAVVAAGPARAAPRPPPRKKKKRSGRRR
jgi:YidC/Oxa1 family membrane protein insertase